jgi:hypothetical protein
MTGWMGSVLPEGSDVFICVVAQPAQTAVTASTTRDRITWVRGRFMGISLDRIPGSSGYVPTGRVSGLACKSDPEFKTTGLISQSSGWVILLDGFA